MDPVSGTNNQLTETSPVEETAVETPPIDLGAILFQTVIFPRLNEQMGEYRAELMADE